MRSTKDIECQKRWNARNPEKLREYSRRWRSKNREAVSLQNRINYAKIKSDPIKYARYLKLLRDLRKHRYQVDEVFRIYCNARSKIICALRKGRNQKRGRTEELLGCTIVQLKDYLELQFQNGMSWNNKSDWHIDHIRSCASFDLSKPEQVKRCFHYTNLRPIWGKDNREKWAHFDGYHHNSVRHRQRNCKGQFIPNQ